ncbi:MAG: TetR/AcrR family transcriptional regulator [Bacteroidota bacterium]
MSPRTTKQFEEIREQSREKILNAAKELFGTQGYHSTSISAIAKKAGVAKGLIYNYFDNKQELMVGIFHQGFQEGEQILAKMMALPDARAKLKFIIDFSFDYFVSNEHESRLVTSIAVQLESFPDMKELVVGKYRGLLPMLEGLLTEIGIEHPEEEAGIIAALLDGLGLQYLVLGDNLKLDAIKKQLYRTYNLQ